jgi:arylsulfatase A-like enzyme
MRFNGRCFVWAVALRTSALACSGYAATDVPLGGSAKTRPNVVIFFTDDQGTLDVNCYGSKDLYTPNMDKLAETGVRFTQAYAHCVCCPARAMLLTGRHPQRSNVNTWCNSNPNRASKQGMSLDEKTIAEILRDAGYRTGIFGKWHLGADNKYGPLEQGFDEHFGNRGGFIDNYVHFFLHGKGFHDLFDGEEEVFKRGEYFPDLMTTRAIQFLERNKDNPFFMYMPFNIPHYPEQPDKKYDERYKDLRMPRQSYAKMISTTDDRMGVIMDRLEALGLREDTIIIFMSDNGHDVNDTRIRVSDHTSGLPKGYYYGAHRGGGNTGKWRGHKNTFWEGGIRVPAVISFPAKLPRGVVRDQAITAADWFPTIMELCGIPLPGITLDGKSLLSIINSADAPTHHRVMHWQWGTRWAVREGEWKLIGSKGTPLSLGNLNGDKPEKKNCLKERPDLVERLKRLHDEWVEEVMPR